MATTFSEMTSSFLAFRGNQSGWLRGNTNAACAGLWIRRPELHRPFARLLRRRVAQRPAARLWRQSVSTRNRVLGFGVNLYFIHAGGSWFSGDSADTWSNTGKVLLDQTHREFVYRPFQSQKRCQPFISMHNEPSSIVAVRICNKNCSPLTING
jgi:hypothetical protein